MTLLPASAIARLRDLAVRTMGDSCQRLERIVAGSDSHHRPQYTYQPGDTLVCGVKPTSSRGPASHDATGNAVIADYILRLPYGTILNHYDRIRILARHGETLSQPIDADIIGVVEAGLTVVLVNLKVVLYD